MLTPTFGTSGATVDSTFGRRSGLTATPERERIGPQSSSGLSTDYGKERVNTAVMAGKFPYYGAISPILRDKFDQPSLAKPCLRLVHSGMRSCPHESLPSRRFPRRIDRPELCGASSARPNTVKGEIHACL
jgi:hypothetical protein